MTGVVAKARILFVGAPGFGSLSGQADFFSDAHFSDYDIVVVEPHGCLESREFSYAKRVKSSNDLELASEEGEFFERRLRDVQKKFNAYLKGGGFLVVFARNMPTLQYYRGGYDHAFRINEVFPYGSLSLQSGVGENIDPSNAQPYGDFWRNTKGAWQYSAFLAASAKVAIASVKGHVDEVVAIDAPLEDGARLVVLPGPKIMPSGAATLASYKAIVDAIQSLYAELTGEVQKPLLPEWVGAYRLPGEKAGEDAIANTNAQIKALYVQQKEQQRSLGSLQFFKTLVGGAGGSLESAVDLALAELGMTVEAGKPKRVDRVGLWQKHVFAIEVQGVKNSAAEDHARSLMMWCQEVALEKKQEPKGLLVVNGFRETDVQQRKKDIWPDKVVEICERYKFCAITSMQLMALLFTKRQEPHRADELLQALLDTNGVFAGYDDWQTFLSKG